jgi:hypothetical protein
MMNSEKSDINEKIPKDKNKVVVQIIWGIALTLAGIGVFFRIPQVMPRIEEIKQFSSVIFFIRFSFYLLGMLLIGGGLKKIYINFGILKDR